jgi:hypothetical protein
MIDINGKQMKTLQDMDNTYLRGGFYLYGFLDFIDKYVKEDFTICELGTWIGESSVLLARKCKFVYTVDLDMNGQLDGISKRDRFYKKIYDYKISNKIQLIETYSSKASEYFENESLDLVYIDANHEYEYIKDDIIKWMPKVKKSGFLCGHDYDNGEWLGVRQAVNEVLGEPDEIFSDLTWVYKMTK